MRGHRRVATERPSDLGVDLECECGWRAGSITEKDAIGEHEGHVRELQLATAERLGVRVLLEGLEKIADEVGEMLQVLEELVEDEAARE